MFEDRGTALFRQVAENQGPTRLSFSDMDIDGQSLRHSISQSTNLTHLGFHYCTRLSIPLIMQSVAHNKALVEFDALQLWRIGILSEVDWAGAFHSIRSHPTLKRLEFLQ